MAAPTSKDLFKSSVLVEKLTLERIQEIKAKLKSAPTKPKPNGRGRPKNTKGTPITATTGPRRQEIKLDTLKAGEIETLIKTLTNSSASPGIPSIRKSNRIIKERTVRNYGELDDEDMEIIRQGSAYPDPPIKHKVKEDIDFDDNDAESDNESDSDYSTSSASSTEVVKRGSARRDRSKPVIRKVLRMKDGEMKEKIVESTYYCRLCKVQYPLPREYLTHMKSKHLKDDQYPCPFCDEKFDRLKMFTYHVDRHLNPKSWFNKAPAEPGSKPLKPPKHKCTICGRIVNLHSVESHMKHHAKRAEDSSKPFQCPMCLHRFFRQEKLRNHFVSHLETNPFTCKFSGCGRKFTSERTLRNHVEELHSGSRTEMKCTFCPASYVSKEGLVKHIKRFHSENSTGEAPRIRRKKPEASNLNGELPNGTNEDKDEDTRFEVESIHLADKIIAAEDGDIHIKGETLSPLKPTPAPSSSVSNCSDSSEESQDSEDEDGDQSVESPSFNLHKYMLNDPVVKRLLAEKPEAMTFLTGKAYGKYRKHQQDGLKCDLCEWSTTRAYMLQRHKKACHTGAQVADTDKERATSTNSNSDASSISFTCGSCGYLSKTSGELAAHMSKVHTMGKKFHCSFCGTRFETKTRKDLHERKVHIHGKKFCCTKCNAKFSYEKSLKKHQKKHDPNYKEKAFEYNCTKCKRGFHVLSFYKAHLKGHEEKVELRTCKICMQTCATIYTLRRHIQYVHLGARNPFEQRNKEKNSITEGSKNDESVRGANGNAETINPTITEGLEKTASNNNDNVDSSINSAQTETPTSSTEESSAILGF